MVYCGKPSNSCHACRERKTRCDARPGGCTQCERAKRKCPGYRSQVDLLFRDQSQNVARKAKARALKDSLKKGSLESSLDASERGSLILQEQLEMCTPEVLGGIVSLHPTMEDKATCYFLYNHAMGITVPGYGDITNLTATHMMRIMDPTLASSLKAASLASYAHHVRSSELAINSRYHYTKAIQLTNTALASSMDAGKDSTLFSVLLLSLYEILTGQNQRSMADWSRHVHGAAALLKLRGPQQFETPVGRRMFIQASSSLLASCMQRGLRVPDHIIEMMEDLYDLMSKFGDFATLSLRIFRVLLACNILICDRNDGTISDPDAIIARALELDEPLAAVCKDHPPEWQFEVISGQQTDPDIVFNDCYHVYSNAWVVSLWNSLRTFRLVLNQLIREVLLEGFAAKPPTFTSPEYTMQYQRSTEIGCEMQASILASVPQALGFVRSTGIFADGFNSPIPLDYVKPVWTPIIISHAEGPSYNGYVLLWPLWFTGWVSLATDDVRAYASKNLRRIGENMGIRQAFVLAKIVEENIDPTVWTKSES